MSSAKLFPIRTCIACKRKAPSRELVRVRTGLLADPPQPNLGRGASLCFSPECWSRALNPKLLSYVFRRPVTPPQVALIQHYLENSSR